mgnify:CR=1 FL=1
MTREEGDDARQKTRGCTDQIDGSRRVAAAVIRARDLPAEDGAASEGDAEQRSADAESKPCGPSSTGLALESQTRFGRERNTYATSVALKWRRESGICTPQAIKHSVLSSVGAYKQTSINHQFLKRLS